MAEAPDAALRLTVWSDYQAWLIDQRLLVPGAQPHDVFARVLERLGHRPLVARRSNDAPTVR